ncbi:MAG: hypothetical protein JNL26_15950 [Gemmatimonadetes bacterium]|nr:hypothetical protein [Gemmatimonadota bacterium]
MATQADVRRIARSLDGTVEEQDRFAFGVPAKGKVKSYAWVWLERIDPKKARVPNPKVLALRVRNLEVKQLMLAAEPDKFFTEPHYNGYPAVLLRLATVRVPELRTLLREAWEVTTPAPARASRKGSRA